MELYLGIDGGGTRTTAWLGDGDGKILSRAEAGPSNPHKVGLASATREIAQLFSVCLKKSDLSSSRRKADLASLQAVCAGIAGSDRNSIHAHLLRWMRQNIAARHYILTSDAAIALSAAFDDSPGIIVMSGTGSIAYGRNGKGEIVRAGGWGIPYDDCGSGYEIGREAVAAALHAYDGRGRHTKLTNLICRRLKLKSIDEIVGRQLEQREIAAIFPLVIKAASHGDKVARTICTFAAKDLASLAIALLKRMASTKETPRMVMAGGVFESSPMIRNAFKRSLRAHFRGVRVKILDRAPVEGALWLARKCGHRKTKASRD